MDSMLSVDNISRYTSSSQDYGPSSPRWSSSKSSNGPGSKYTIIGKSGNHPNFSSIGANNGAFQQQQRQVTPGGRNGFRVGSSGPNQNSCIKEGRNSSLLYNTGEPLGSLSSSIVDAVKRKMVPTREEMKEKHVMNLSSDANIGILPGYKSNGFPAGSFHGLRNPQSSPHPRGGGGGSSERYETERLPSPVTRAQAAIGKTRQEIGATQDILQGNKNQISGIYRHPRGDPWVNASTPGIGGDTMSMKRIKQDSYRRELETQMEQSRIRKEVETRKERDGLEHPLGTRYSSHSPYTFSVEEPSSLPKNNPTSYTNYIKTNTDEIGQKKLNPSFRKSDSERPGGTDSKLNPSSPWLDEKRPPLPPPSQNPYPQPIQSNPGQGAQPSRQPQLPYQDTQYFSQPQFPVYPYGYPYPPQPIPNQQMPFPMYSQPPPQIPPFQQYPQQMFPPGGLPQFMPRADPQIQAQYFPSSGENLVQFRRSGLDEQLEQERCKARDAKPSDSDCDVEVDETVMRQHVWQTSDQLPSDDLKKAVYKTMLKKQILEKKRHAQIEREKEIEENEKLERSIEEYQEKMRKQMESEQLLLKLKHGRVGELYPEETQWSHKSPPETKLSPRQSVAAVRQPTAISQTEYDEKPCKSFVNVELGDGDGNQNQAISSNLDQSMTDSIGNALVEIPSNTMDLVSISGELGNGDGETVKNQPIFQLEEDHFKSKSKFSSKNGLKTLQFIQNALAMELQRMEHLLGKRNPGR